jgi:nicotinamidase-related amidase
MLITCSNTIAFVVDIQERLFPHINNNTKLETNIITLLQGLQALEVQTFVFEQYTKGLGTTIPSVKSTLGNAYVPSEKICFSVLGDDKNVKLLRDTNKKRVILCGIETHVCILQTALDLLERGYTPVIPVDCVGSRSELDHNVAIERLRTEGAIITTKESILFELLRIAGTDQFKAVSQLVK